MVVGVELFSLWPRLDEWGETGEDMTEEVAFGLSRDGT